MMTIIKKYYLEIIFGIIFLVYFSGIIENVEIYGIGLGALSIAYGIYDKIKNRNKVKSGNILSLKTNNDQYRKTSKLILGIIAIIGSVIGILYMDSEKAFFTILIILGFLLLISSLLSENSSFIEIVNGKLRYENNTDLALNNISSINLTESEIVFNQVNNSNSRISFLDNDQDRIEQIKEFFRKHINEIKIE
ncbi:hypothetical protein F6U93_06220 [Tamlana haliotis]|uniref:Uncharacterized protein n=1 Tax=Pseudotamlana haliotis TaxID=2614804 RepID=A0A6N6MGL9_9FLAO|nr:hypothetical protein [Tamlana haliotis]KAB1068522.1 hypothetical protein F6U93_06220 [Tamlana haliotis]